MRLILAIFCLAAAAAGAQPWDLGGRITDSLSDAKFKITFEQRGRYEIRTGTAFGRDPDVATGLYRTRLGMSFTPVKWLKVGGMVQDARAPWYGPNAPGNLRDSADLHEAWFELFPGVKNGVGMTAGRMMLNYGEARLIGTPQWGNVSRTYDHARLYYRSARAQVELLFVSPVKVRIGEFNRPALRDHIWGIYNVFPDFYRKNLLEVYLLRREQAGMARVDTAGVRLAGPLPSGAKYSVESTLQTGRAWAWYSSITRRWMAGARPLDLLAEYKYASRAFDQLYAANHDNFGHQDLFGWRNIHQARSQATLGVTRNLALNAMYSSFWLASASGPLYNGAGKAVALSPAGAAGRHVGQETDLFATYKYRHFLFGAGYGHLFAGAFLRHATPAVGPAYLYVFHRYSF